MGCVRAKAEGNALYLVLTRQVLGARCCASPFKASDLINGSKGSKGSKNSWKCSHGEIKPRTEVVGIFPNNDAIIRLVGALLLKQNNECPFSNPDIRHLRLSPP